MDEGVWIIDPTIEISGVKGMYWEASVWCQRHDYSFENDEKPFETKYLLLILFPDVSRSDPIFDSRETLLAAIKRSRKEIRSTEAQIVQRSGASFVIAYTKTEDKTRSSRVAWSLWIVI